MTSEIDEYRSAKLLIDQHGEVAAIQAAMEAGAMLDRGGPGRGGGMAAFEKRKKN